MRPGPDCQRVRFLSADTTLMGGFDFFMNDTATDRRQHHREIHYHRSNFDFLHITEIAHRLGLLENRTCLMNLVMFPYFVMFWLHLQVYRTCATDMQWN
ncbi:hypothetical protein L2E82_05189 [Cichorium intybus]|uniref:Uncharacterized protein n=1 Tax=Cichorium intybus TaxID=13427 RepID=A0ACB9H8C7_CICIN|nr:hypothetical protein L2E82_05189 [Cichorium intybus]